MKARKMRKTGLSLVEILVTLGIVGIVAAIVFINVAPMRERGRQSACASQMKQLFQELSIYSHDNDSENSYPELHGLAYLNSTGTELLIQKNPTIWWCPTAPVIFRRGGHSPSYLSSIFFSPVDEAGNASHERMIMITKEKVSGSKTRILECTSHDEFFYSKSEKDIDPSLAHPWKQELYLDGSVKLVRSNEPRDFPITSR